MERRHRIRRIANFVNLSTPLGLLISVAGGARRTDGPNGLILAYGYRFAFPVAGAFTVGNVVLTKHPDGYLTDRLLEHEGRHATQWAWCAGLPMLPLYLLSLAVSMLICGDQAAYNPFERLAGLEDGGYPRKSPWWRRNRTLPEGIIKGE
ncbi:hypothetical protein [Nonomuraea africana]|uniref:DUF4157 domain-containing protein n=1 Tax=Nonomuraea africana TaxID=46171 RepID=A0ABR9KNJ4_9ACTN|nr:hypothetical protein [Nonomuraea africana]MBE1563336.1 hypothetical protein [Nonomuraea africana]